MLRFCRLHQSHLESCRATFGDDREDYDTALQRHYAEGVPAQWRDSFVSAYATTHPWEDFAETFAAWLTPRSAWRKRYRGWGAMAKLQYMNRIARELGNVDPVRRRGRTDITVDEMEATVAEFYQRTNDDIPLEDLALDTDLRDIFDASKRRKTARPAHEFLHAQRKAVVDKVAYWTGAQRPLIKKLIEVIEKRIDELGLFADTARESEHLIQITVYVTALAMNYMARGKFVHP